MSAPERRSTVAAAAGTGGDAPVESGPGSESARAGGVLGASGQVGADPWAALRRFTAARIALGHAGVSLPTARHLEFQLAHAGARDAVHASLDVEALEGSLRRLGLDVVRLHSAASDRQLYLQRPDLGRRLDEPSRGKLLALADEGQARFDVAFVVADGLSAQAVARHAAPLLERLLPALAAQGRNVAPVSVVRQGRVAVGDEIGQLLGAQIVVVLVGERPGLSSPESLGIYLTWQPRLGRVDSERNCISNVRPDGLDYEMAASRLAWLLEQARARGLTGVALKDETDVTAAALGPISNFLLSD